MIVISFGESIVSYGLVKAYIDIHIHLSILTGYFTFGILCHTFAAHCYLLTLLEN